MWKQALTSIGALALVFGLAASLSLAHVGPYRKGGSSKKYQNAVGAAGPTEGTAARTWQHAFYFDECVTSPDYNTMTDRVGSMDLTESTQTTYTCGVATTGLDVASVGIPANSGMNVDGACWESGAGNFPEIADGFNILFRVTYRDNAGQGGNRRFWDGQLSGGDFFRPIYNSLESVTFQVRDNTGTILSVVRAIPPGTGELITLDIHFEDSTDTWSVCRDETCSTGVMAADPLSFPARRFSISGQFDCGGTTSFLDDVDLFRVSVAYCSSGCAAAGWTALGMHADDCAADGTC